MQEYALLHTREKREWHGLSMMTARGQPIYCGSGDSHETRVESFSEPGHVSKRGDARPTPSLLRILYEGIRSTRDHSLALGGDRRRQAALPDRRPRPSAHPAARLRRNLVDVEADHASAGRAIYSDRAGPARHRRLGDP